MAHISQDSSTNDAISPASTSSLSQDEHKNRRKRKPKESGAESNNIRPPHKVFSSAIRAELYEYLDGYPLERLNDSNTTYLDNQMRQVNFLLDTSKYVVPVEERVCPHCGANGKLHKHETEQVQLSTYPCDDLPTTITVIRQWYKCQECRNLCVDVTPGRFERTLMTRKLVEAIFDKLMLGYKGTARDLAICYRISEKQVYVLMDRYEAEHGPKGSAQKRQQNNKKQTNN